MLTTPCALLCALLGLLVVLAGLDLLVAHIARPLGGGAFVLGLGLLAVGAPVQFLGRRGAAHPARWATKPWPWGGVALAIVLWLLAKVFWSLVWEGLLFTMIVLTAWVGTWWCLGTIAWARRAGRMPRSWVGIVLTLLLLIGWGLSWWLLYDRHGLPDEVPLPTGVVYQATEPLIFNRCGCCPSCHKETIGTVWLWTSSDPPATIEQFYLNQLHADHQWRFTSLQVVDNLRTGKELQVEVTSQAGAVRAPPGGSVIRLSYYWLQTITP